ncbi:hypothetical protein HK100_003533 [Physocladia obscura]|uniref:Inositol hexakisphosphate and diphosphoinositol-pentakisphosphate kinase n=1 Tax=Physocladia obscura TaxID=109957 RepID=A0AAD5SVI7_9FUNG|nr:hypothetical protein HK100_003533 [Physocladia obscura]
MSKKTKEQTENNNSVNNNANDNTNNSNKNNETSGADNSSSTKRSADSSSASSPQPPPAKRLRKDSSAGITIGAELYSGAAAGPPESKWIVGVACMDIKARSKPMRNILTALIRNHGVRVVVFGDKVLLDESINSWPTCHFLISFFSTGFPLDKAIAYVNLRQPFCINNLLMQKVLMDRRLVLGILDYIGVPTPNRLVSNAPAEVEAAAALLVTPDIVDHIRSNVGLDLQSTSGENESLFSAGTVVQMDNNTIRLGEKVLVKPFVEKPVSGEDHNIYIYYHSSEGGGVRKLFRKVGNKSSEFCPEIFTVRAITNPTCSYIYEQFMSVDNAEDVKVYTIGKDFAHAETRKSPVVDGVVRRNSDGKEVRYVTPLSPDEAEYSRRVCKAFGQTVCGFDLLRADGTSYVIDVNGWSFVKGNMEYYERCSRMLNDLFEVVGENVVKRKQLVCSGNSSSGIIGSSGDGGVVKNGLRLAMNGCLGGFGTPGQAAASECVENHWRLKAFISVLRHGDRTPKQKAKFNFKSKPFMDLLNGLEEEVVLKTEEQLRIVSAACNLAIEQESENQTSLTSLRTILDFKSSLPGTKVQIKPSYSKADKAVLEKAQLIVKWGGEFTHGGKNQSKDMGENLRNDLRIINPAVLDDVKIYSSSERRVTATAEVCAKALLDTDLLPDDLIKINKEMLDDSNAAKEQIEQIKNRLQEILNPHAPTKIPDHYLPENIKDPEAYLHELMELMKKVRTVMRASLKSGGQFLELKDKWCCFESPLLFEERWERIFKEFCDVERSVFEPSKISELYDSLKYDLLHNREFLDHDKEDLLRLMYNHAKTLFDFIGPQEYGIEPSEKLEIGKLCSQSLLKQLVSDLHEAKNLTQINFELYERSNPKNNNSGNDDDCEMDENNSGREYSLRIGFSPGAHDPNLMDMHFDDKHSLTVSPRRWISDHISLDEALTYLGPQSDATSVPTVILGMKKTG